VSEVRKGTSRNTENENKRCKILYVIQLSDRVYNVTFPAYDKYLSRDILCNEVSHKGKSCSIFLNQHNFICSKFNKLYNYNINILHNKTTGL
jgi:hypothetical protein